jgi:hypothetical protein
MLKLASKFAMDILPSVIATVIGAYIVNHYINNRPPSGATAAAVSSIDGKKAASKGDSKPAEKSADLGRVLEPGVRAKGIPEKSISDRTATEKVIPEKSADKPDKPSETASIPPTTIPVEPRRHQPSSRERAASKPLPAPAPAVPVTEPAIAATSAPEPTPDANDLARAAIERLRSTEPSHPTEAVRSQPETPRVVAAPVVTAPQPAPAITAPPIQPLPPPILVSTPPADSKGAIPPVRTEDPNRPTPPADIPDPRPPLDLRADAAPADTPPKRPSVAEDVLSAAKSMFHSVLPK